MRIPAPLSIFIVCVITALCLAAPVETTTPLIGPYALGAPVHVGSLTVWPVYTKKPLAIGEFLTLQEAEKAGLVKIEEIGGGAGEGQQRNDPAQSGQQRLGSSDRAEVGRLVIVNGGKLPILVCAGTVVVGGKQDRQIGKDFVIAAGKRVMVASFCVEQGRWSATRDGQATAGKFKVAGYIAPEGVRKGGQYLSDQHDVWRNVAAVNGKRKTAAHGSSLANATEKADKAARAADADMAKRVRAHFAERKAVGFAYAIQGKPVTVRTFAHERVFSSQFGLFVPAMCIEAQLAGQPKERVVARAEDVAAMVAELQKAAETEHKTSGSNTNGIAKNAKGYRANCYIVDGKKKVAVTRDWTRK